LLTIFNALRRAARATIDADHHEKLELEVLSATSPLSPKP
jgi:hypothetical protein